MTAFTDASVKALPLPTKGSKIYFDPALPGFGVRITANDARSFIIDYRVRASGRQRRYTIGAVGNWTVGMARKKARELRREVDSGGDPLGELQGEREAPTVADLIERFDAEHITPYLRPNSQHSYRLALAKHIGPHFGQHVKVADVKFGDITALHAKLSKAGKTFTANRTIAICSKMFSLAVRWQMCDDNPCRGISRNHEGKRKRYLTGDELPRLIKALATYPDESVANIIRLLLMTGARSGEVFAMRWGNIDLGDDQKKATWSKAASTTKQQQDHTVPLSAPVRMLLTEIAAKQKKPLGTFVFPSNGNPTGRIVTIKQAWKTICENAGIEGLRIHDLRHSFASELISSGASLALVGALLGHSNPSTTARYAHMFDDPMRKAVETVGAVITAAGKPTAAVPELPRRPKRVV
jgi:integrase